MLNEVKKSQIWHGALAHEKILLEFLNTLKTPEISVDLFLIQMWKICVVLVRSSPACLSWLSSPLPVFFGCQGSASMSVNGSQSRHMQEIKSCLNKYNNFLSHGHFNILNERGK